METPALPPIDEFVAVVEARAAEQLPAARLQAALEVGRELTDLSDALIGRFVAIARDAGLSWSDIGQVFGTSKQAVQQRYGQAVADPSAWARTVEPGRSRGAQPRGRGSARART